MVALITDYMKHGSGAPSGAPSVPSGETAYYYDDTNDLFYVWKPGATAWHLAGGGGGGGATIGSGTTASRPAAGTAGNVYLPTDGPYLYRDTGTAWEAWGLLRKLTPPVASEWTALNASTGVTDSAGGYLSYTIAQAGLGVNHHGLVRTLPSAPYTLTLAAWLLISPNGSNAQPSILWRNSTSGALSGFARLSSGNVELQKWTSATAWSANYSAYSAITYGLSGQGVPLWLRFRDDSTNRYIDASYDAGFHWRNLLTVGRTDFLTPDQLFIGVDTENDAGAMGITLLSFAVS